MLPTLWPDMTLYSVAACAHRMAGSSRGSDTSLALFGDPHAGLWHDFPINLHEFCRRTKGHYGDAAEVARTTTTMPYFTRFRSPEFATEALAVVSGPNADRLKFLLGLPAGPTRASFPLRACSRCMHRDEQAHGTAYWHRIHQLPGVYRCQMHGVPLLQSPLRVDRRCRSVFVLPGDHRVFTADPPVPNTGPADNILLRLANLSADVLHHPLPVAYCATHQRTTYLHGLRDRGLLTRSGLVRAKAFLKWIKDEYSTIAGLPPYDWILSDEHIEGLLRLVRKPRADFNASYHVLVIDALFGSWQRFAEVYAWEEVMNLDSKKYGLSAAALDQEAVLDPNVMALAERLKTSGQGLSQLCAEAGIDYQTALRKLAPLGLAEPKRRPKVMTNELRLSVATALRRGTPQRDVARQFGLSRATIDRVCVEVPNLHREWLSAAFARKRDSERTKLEAFLARNSSLTISAIRGSSGTGYCWLQRYDANWLRARIPRVPTKRPPRNSHPAPRVDWSARDATCLSALQSLAPSLLFDRGERLEPGVVLRKLPRLPFVPRLAHLPRSQAYVAELLSKLRTRE